MNPPDKSKDVIISRSRCSIASECPRKNCIMQLVFNLPKDFDKSLKPCKFNDNKMYEIVDAPDNLKLALKPFQGKFDWIVE